MEVLLSFTHPHVVTKSKPLWLNFFCGTLKKRKPVVWLCDLLACSRFRDRLCHGASRVKPTWVKLSWHQQRRVTRPQIPHLTYKQNEKHIMNSHSQNTHTPLSLVSQNNRTTHGIKRNSFFFYLIFCFLLFPNYPLIAYKMQVMQFIHHK